MGIVQYVTRENSDIGWMERVMFSILNKDRVIEYSNEIPVFLQDLNANVIIESITDDWGEEASNMFLKLPESKETGRQTLFKKCVGRSGKLYDIWGGEGGED